MLRILISGLVVIGLCTAWLSANPHADGARDSQPKLRSLVRRPVALVAVDDKILVGNEKSGSISVIESATGVVVAEHEIAASIADMIRLGGSSDLLVLDHQERKLLRVSGPDGSPTVDLLTELPVAASKMVFDPEHHRVYATAKWSHCALAITLDASLRKVTDIQITLLPFAPLELLLLPEHDQLLVADAFGGNLGLLDSRDGKLLCVRKIDGHNLRGLALSENGRSVLIGHQHIPERGLADYEEVHWGRVVTNAVQVVRISDLQNAKTEQPAEGWLDTYGGIGSAAADPSGVVTGANGFVAVAFAGVDEVAVRYAGYNRRLPVQSQPGAMARSGNRLFIANRLDDSVSVIDLPNGKVVQTITLGPKPELTSEQRGERLFFSAKLSHDGWLSCHSCHTEGHTAGLIVDTLGDGDYGAPKLVPSLLGTRDTQPWSWDGSAALLREQVQKSITSTMHGEAISAREMEDLFAFLSSLDSPPPPKVLPKNLIDKGQAVFHERGCVNCHAPPAFTTPETFEVSLLDELKRNRFNPPSLRGASQRSRYFHDGRANSLEDVLQKVKHQLDTPLTKTESQALLAYLRSL